MDYQLGRSPKALDLTVADGSVLGAGNLNIFDTTSVNIAIKNRDSSHTVTCQINGDTECTFTLNPFDTVGFSAMDGVVITSVDFANSSGADVNVLVFYGEDAS